jgi:Fe-S-cluster-containing dehydrogenase component/DMSO reductase anchor subunit
MISHLDPPAESGRTPAEPMPNRKLSFVDDLLLEQQTLRTPVALFSDLYDGVGGGPPSPRFSHLIPLSKPEADEQYAFEVDLDACTGCKACVAACHSLNGLDDNESWRDVGALMGTRRKPYVQTVTTACHHCEDPACMNGCPVLAYDKDAVTGIVRHLDDQCIGCSYCILKCPYDVPKFNLKRGIVRKCDMCQGRLAEGEAPACVQSCPNEAIKIRTVKRQKTAGSPAMLPGAFESSYTRPTTRYITQKPIPAQVVAADAARIELDHAHTPLAWMLVLTQMSAGAFLLCAAALWANVLDLKQAGITGLTAFAIGFIGIHLSVLHLGQPLKAWRAFMGWRKSWLSREIIIFGAFAGSGMTIPAVWWLGDIALMRAAMTLTAVIGIIAVFCSIMVYVDTRRPFWSMSQTTGKFAGTTLLLGAALCATTWSWIGMKWASEAALVTLVLRWTLSLWEMGHITRAYEDENSTWHKSARLLRERLRTWLDARVMLLVLTGLMIPVIMAAGTAQPVMITIALLLTLMSQLMERHYFFTAAAGPRMPGN